MNYQSAAASYNQIKTHAGVESASPHRLIEMLLEGLLERITQAKGAMQFKNTELKGKKINSAIAIVNGLRENLNQDAGEIAENLDGLYVYIQNILTQANIKNDIRYLDEAAGLVENIHNAWSQIA